MVVDIFIPCFIDQLYPETGYNMLKVLEKAGVDVRYNKNQTCCGQIAFNSGFWNHAKDMGEKFIRDFKDCQYVVAPSASCVSMVRNYYDEMFYNSSLHNDYRLLKKNIFEFSDFMFNILNVRDLGATFNHTVTYHDSCAALREYKLKDEPRQLLSFVRGLKLVEMEDTSTCCGFGGSFAVKNEDISVAMTAYKLDRALETGAEFIVSTDSSCLMQMDAYIKKQNLPIKTIHLVDILASGWAE